jgi:hypothetical protein
MGNLPATVLSLPGGGALAAEPESQQQSEFLRGLRKAQKIRVRLGGTPNLLHPFPEKPKGMHWRSYRRIKRVYETAKRSSK